MPSSRTVRTDRTRNRKGVALLMAIFCLMLISGVAIALIVNAGTESAIAGNYRSSTQAFYAAFAGLEEARGRMWQSHPNSLFSITNFLPSIGTALAVGQVRYVLNPASGETVSPTNLATTNAYRDTEYQQEWGVAVNDASVTVQTTTSVSTVAGLAGPLFKWVRITCKTELAGNTDVNGDSTLNNTTPLFYDGTSQNLSSRGYPVFRLTTLAVMPGGARRILQYDIAQITFGMGFPSAMTFDGAGSTFPTVPSSNNFRINGNDRSGSDPPPGTCPPAGPAVAAAGTVNNTDKTAITTSINAKRPDHYTGAGAAPDVENISGSLAANLTTVTGIVNMVEQIKLVANYVGAPAGFTNLGTAASPVISVVTGNLSMSGSVTGYGLLVVTGTLSFSGNCGWRGVVMVVGGGMSENGGGNNEYDGAVFLANAYDSTQTPPTPRAALAAPTLNWNGGGGNGIYYDSCWIQRATGGLSYRPLSFREIGG